MVDGTTGAAAPSALEPQRDAGANGTVAAAVAVAAASASASQPREKLVGPMKQQVVRIEVLGDDKVGKTSLICSLVSRHFSERVPAVLLNVQIPAEENNENVIISITDTSSRVSDIVRVANATKRSDAILLVYDLTRPETIQRLRRWLDLIARHKEVPVVLVGNKDDIKTVVTTGNMMDGLHSSQIRQLTNTYQFAVDGGDCSARNFAQVARAFYYAQKAVLYPMEPLYNAKKRMLEPKCLKAIKRTFRLFDRDRDGLLSREELNEYQQDCFGMRLLGNEMDTMMEFLQSTIPEGVKEDGSGVRFEGFVYLWQLFIDRKRPESCWQVLRSLGYDGSLDLEIPPERITLPMHEEDQSGELTQAAIDFVDGLLRQFDGDKDGNLTEEEVEEIFSICEDGEAPWKTCSAITSPVLYPTTQVADKLVVSRSAWLALWSFVAQENPEKLLETMFYLGYNDKANPAIEFAKGRSTSRQAMKIERKVVTSYVYSNSVALKTRLAHALVGRKTVCTEKADAPMTANELEDNAAEDEAEIHIVRAVNAVAYRDAATYLLLTEELTEGEIEKRGDVVCLLFNPLESESVEAAKTTESKLPATVPRLFIGLKPEGVAVTSSDWEDAIKQTKALGNVQIVEDDKSMVEAFEKLVRTATRPPNARTRRPRSNSFSTATKALVAAATLIGGSALAVRASRDSLLHTLMVLVPRASASLLASR